MLSSSSSSLLFRREMPTPSPTARATMKTAMTTPIIMRPVREQHRRWRRDGGGPDISAFVSDIAVVSRRVAGGKTAPPLQDERLRGRRRDSTRAVTRQWRGLKKRFVSRLHLSIWRKGGEDARSGPVMSCGCGTVRVALGSRAAERSESFQPCAGRRSGMRPPGEIIGDEGVGRN